MFLNISEIDLGSSWGNMPEQTNTSDLNHKGGL